MLLSFVTSTSTFARLPTALFSSSSLLLQSYSVTTKWFRIKREQNGNVSRIQDQWLLYIYDLFSARHRSARTYYQSTTP